MEIENPLWRSLTGEAEEEEDGKEEEKADR